MVKQLNRSVAAFAAASVLLAATLAGCSDAPTGARGAATDPLVDLLVQMGFARDQIVDRGDHFVVEGDMLIAKSGLRAVTSSGGLAHPGQPVFQRYSSAIAPNRRTVRVDLSAVDAVSSSWASAVRTAMANWNAAAGTGYSLVEGGTTDVTVNIAALGNCVAAAAYLPNNGAPGHTLTINSSYLNYYTAGQMAFVATHEFGHILGLTHTDETNFTKVPGTPDSDAGSVMNSGSTYGGCPPAAPTTSTPSYYDQFAARYLYPATLTASVSYPGGTPTVSWNAINGATQYQLYRRTWRIHVGQGTDEWEDSYVGSTTSTSMADGSRSYTGNSWCPFYTMTSFVEEYYYYRVVAVYSGGSLSDVKEAAIGVC